MPITFTKDFPSAGTLGAYVPIYEALDPTGPTALWSADRANLTISGGLVSQMTPVLGAGVLAQAVLARQPSFATRTGRDVVRFDGAQTLGLSTSLGDRGTLTVALAFNQRGSTDAQQILGAQGSPAWRLAFRNAPPGSQFYRLDSAADVSSPAAPDLTGWNTVIITQGGGVTSLSLNGGSFQTAANASALLATFAVGSSTEAVGSWNGELRALGLWPQNMAAPANAADLDLVRKWLNLEAGIA